MDIDKKSMKKLFPHLCKELEGEENRVTIDSVRKDAQTAEKAMETTEEEPLPEPDKFRHYYPTVVDFLRRCDTEAQAEEIVAYLLKRGEVTEEEACRLMAQLKREGVRSFGSKKEENYYFKQSGMC
ncbi:MAG: DUF2095 family protein [Candidatus Bathyarchaeia archaeon]